MTGVPQLSLIIPAFNESLRIERTLDAVLTTVPAMAAGLEVRVVDDGSADDTARRVERIAATHQ